MLPLRKVTRVLALDHQGKILARRKADGQFRLPGGGIDAGETALDAAARELSEETGLELTGAHLVGDPIEWYWKQDFTGLDAKWTMRKKAHAGERMTLVAGYASGAPTTGSYEWVRVEEVINAPYEPEYEAPQTATVHALKDMTKSANFSQLLKVAAMLVHHDAHDTDGNKWMARLAKLKARRGEMSELVGTRHRFDASVPAKDFKWGLAR